MRSMAVTRTLRLLFVLALLFAMPMLAMPPVLRRIDAMLGTDPESVHLVQKQPTDSLSPPKNTQAVHLQRPQQAAAPTLGQGSPSFETSPRFLYIQQRLKHLGANYMALEEVPDQDGTFRFHCRMAIPGSRVYSRPFEVVDTSRRQAMERVLADVENWQATLWREDLPSGRRVYR